MKLGQSEYILSTHHKVLELCMCVLFNWSCTHPHCTIIGAECCKSCACFQLSWFISSAGLSLIYVHRLPKQ